MKIKPVESDSTGLDQRSTKCYLKIDETTDAIGQSGDIHHRSVHRKADTTYKEEQMLLMKFQDDYRSINTGFRLMTAQMTGFSCFS